MRHYYCREICLPREPVIIDASSHLSAAEEFCQEYDLKGMRHIGVNEVNTRGEVIVRVVNGTATGTMQSTNLIQEVRQILSQCTGCPPCSETWSVTDEGVLQYLRDLVDFVNNLPK